MAFFNLRHTRQLLDVTQYLLAKRSGIAQPPISTYEKGLKIPSENHKRRIAAALGIEVDAVI